MKCKFVFIVVMSVVGLAAAAQQKVAATPKKVLPALKRAAAPPTKPEAPPVSAVEYWLTTNDQSVLLKRQSDLQWSGTAGGLEQMIQVDGKEKMQTIDGFGYTLTGGSAVVINRLPAKERSALLKELFGSGNDDIGISYLRLSIGASDLDSAVFSYDDLPPGDTDATLSKFSLAPDKQQLIPLLKAILAINPKIKIIAAPWSSPSWMKTNDSTKGGKLKPSNYPVYAQYFVKYIQGMKAEGITITAITPQNEPLNPKNNPSLVMDADEQAVFIRDHLGPAFKQAGIATKIVTYDHNCDHPDYPITILDDAAARKYVDGSAFHLYDGSVTAMSKVHDAYPDKQLYFTEQYTPSNGDFSENLKWHLKNVIIGSMRNWSRIALEWNLANDPRFGPHTPGGCTTCKGAITIDGPSVVRNVGYYIIAHASKFVPAGAVRIASSIPGDLNNVAFRTPDGQTVLIVENDGTGAAVFGISVNGKFLRASLRGGSVATYRWK